MPHVILEHSLNNSNAFKNFFVNQKKIFANLIDVFSELASIGNFDISQCKFRSIAAENFFVANNFDNNKYFCHLEVRILEGRSADVKKILAQKLFASLKQTLQSLIPLDYTIDLSVNIVEMNKEIYIKGIL
jgi:5-carboxymethyl-2-hydroxymuconate isomerase